jgi:hypothetical protein
MPDSPTSGILKRGTILKKLGGGGGLITFLRYRPFLLLAPRGGYKEMSSWLTTSALVYEPKCTGGGGGSCGVSANEYSCAHEDKINFGDLTPNLTFEHNCTQEPK